MFAPIFGTWPAWPWMSLVYARRTQEDPKTWTKRKETCYVSDSQATRLQDTVSQDPAFGHPRPGVGHLGADIQGTGIHIPAAATSRLTLTRQYCGWSRHTITLSLARKPNLLRRRRRWFDISPSRYAFMIRRQATYQDDKVYPAHLQTGNPTSSQSATKPVCHYISERGRSVISIWSQVWL